MQVQDGTPVWGKRYIDGPGVWVTCTPRSTIEDASGLRMHTLGTKGKEKQAVGELYELFKGLGSELWPETEEGKVADDDSDDEPEEGLSIEAQIASEVSAMKKPKKEQRFTNCQTNTPCREWPSIQKRQKTWVLPFPVVFISCKPPVDPVKLVMNYLYNVEKTGLTQTRYSLRFTPVSAACVTNLQEIQILCRTVLEPFFGEGVEGVIKYKIELKIRNHTTLARMTLIEAIAACVPERHKVDLDDPELVIIVEVFKSICGVSVVRDYYKLQKFNAVEIASTHSSENPSSSVSRIE
ncbi:hypothetical protein B0H16DRAFT_402001 [Mycena metata]|uniref:THUMP domain-containing protein n=1 Tax=Mycena metata TaxID=1033252 RepID=A0AAD7JIW3_9AGAR|nr:hypothetical protein B0H16DRAFT_402001 [Mycena metata]